MYEVYSRSDKLFCYNNELEPRLVIRLQSTVNPKKSGGRRVHWPISLLLAAHVGSWRDMVICKYWFKMLITDLLPCFIKIQANTSVCVMIPPSKKLLSPRLISRQAEDLSLAIVFTHRTEGQAATDKNEPDSPLAGMPKRNWTYSKSLDLYQFDAKDINGNKYVYLANRKPQLMRLLAFCCGFYATSAVCLTVNVACINNTLNWRVNRNTFQA